MERVHLHVISQFLETALSRGKPLSHGTTHLMETGTTISQNTIISLEHHSHGKPLQYLMEHQTVAEQHQSLHSLTHLRRTLSLVWNSAMTNIQQDTFNLNRASVILESHKFICGSPLSWNTTVSKNTSNPSLNCYRWGGLGSRPHL